VNKLVQKYIKETLNKAEVTGNEKEELEIELSEHLMLLTNEYLQKGLTEEEAVKFAIRDFGDERTIGEGLNNILYPYRNALKIIGWASFILYSSVVFLILLSPLRRSAASFFHEDLWVNINFIPFKSIIWYTTGFEHINLNTIIYNTLGNIIIFIPLGFFLIYLVKRIKSLGSVLLVSVAISLFIEVSQLVLRLGQGDVDDILLNTVGALIGYFLFKLTSGIGMRYIKMRSTRSQKIHFKLP
jgi:glycopeptide antibiotics resistance protein